MPELPSMREPGSFCSRSRPSSSGQVGPMSRIYCRSPKIGCLVSLKVNSPDVAPSTIDDSAGSGVGHREASDHAL